MLSHTIAMKRVVGNIDLFTAKCEEEEYTDTGEVHELLQAIRADLFPYVCTHEPNLESVRYDEESKMCVFDCKHCRATTAISEVRGIPGWSWPESSGVPETEGDEEEDEG